MSIAENLSDIDVRIAAAAKKAGRDVDSIRLVAVSKRFPTTCILEANLSGQYLFGENYIQEAAAKHQELLAANTFNGRLHFIGHLQSNKAKTAAAIFSMVETLDRIKLAQALDKYLGQLDKKLDVLIQVNVGKDDNKAGVMAEDARDLISSVYAKKLDNLRICGLMTMPPLTDNNEQTRGYFRELRSLSEDLGRSELFHDNENVELSMGMSGDFEIAIEEGATLVRIGTAIFGNRPPLQTK